MNASYIAGESSEREYIATQGPLDRTEAEFWQMIWEQEVSQIVKLCMPQEERNGQIRFACEEYWPTELNEDMWKGFIKVTLLNEEVIT